MSLAHVQPTGSKMLAIQYNLRLIWLKTCGLHLKIGVFQKYATTCEDENTITQKTKDQNCIWHVIPIFLMYTHFRDNKIVKWKSKVKTAIIYYNKSQKLNLLFNTNYLSGILKIFIINIA